MPPSDEDKPNPYAAPGAWPKMPSAPFKVGSLSKAPPEPPPTPNSFQGRNSILGGSAVPGGAQPALTPPPAPPAPPAGMRPMRLITAPMPPNPAAPRPQGQ